jgi:endo-1,4-beta-mannosidase
MGANFIPSVAASPIEMWQPETFNSGMIERELGIAESVGMNSVRVFLNYLVWQRDPAGHQKRMNAFLRIADRHQIRTIFVLFDSCWDPFPELGPQRPPLPGIHNSRWGQSPGMKALYDDKHVNQLMDYVHDVILPSPSTSGCLPGTCGTSRTTPTKAVTEPARRRTRCSE